MRTALSLILVLALAVSAAAQTVVSPIAHLSRAEGVMYIGIGNGRCGTIQTTANVRSLLQAADYAAMRTLLSLATANTPQFAGLGLGAAAQAGWPLTIEQSATDQGMKLGFGGKSCQWYLQTSGATGIVAYNGSLALSSITGSVGLNGYGGGVNLRTAAANSVSIFAGGFLYVYDIDDNNALRWSVNTATGEIAIPSNTVGLKLNASGTTTIKSDTTNLTFADPTNPGGKTLAQLATDTDTLGAIGSVANGDIVMYNSGWKRLAKGNDGQVLKLGSGLPSWAADTDTNYSAGNGLDLTDTTFSLDLKSGGGLEIDNEKLRLSTHEAAATQAGSGATATLDFSTNAIIKFTFDNNGGDTTFTFTDPPAGSRCLLVLIQDGDGGESVVWPAAETIYWAGGEEFVPDTTASSRAVVTLVYDGTDYYCTGYDYATAP